jgi:hypothetical protein
MYIYQSEAKPPPPQLTSDVTLLCGISCKLDMDWKKLPSFTNTRGVTYRKFQFTLEMIREDASLEFKRSRTGFANDLCRNGPYRAVDNFDTPIAIPLEDSLLIAYKKSSSRISRDIGRNCQRCTKHDKCGLHFETWLDFSSLFFLFFFF